MKSNVEPNISSKVYLTLTEEETRALVDIIAFGVDAFPSWR